MDKSIIPLNNYIETFEKCDKDVMLDVEEYIKNITDAVNADEMSLKEVQKDIQNHTKLEEEIYNFIPETITVSIFKVDIKDTRNYLANKRRKIINLEKDLIAKKAIEKRAEVQAEFDEIKKNS